MQASSEKETEPKTTEGVMEGDGSLLQAAAEDILEEYFPRPRIIKPPPEVPETDRSMKQGRYLDGFQVWRKRANCDQSCSSLHAIPGDEDIGMSVEEIKAFLSSRLKRGKGNVGSQETTYLSNSGGGILGSRSSSDVWSRLNVVRCHSKSGADVGQLLKLSDPVIAWKQGIFGPKKRDHSG